MVYILPYGIEKSCFMPMLPWVSMEYSPTFVPIVGVFLIDHTKYSERDSLENRVS